jgi:N-acetyl-anhydromuramyl-L-alanine amidase AmpD
MPQDFAEATWLPSTRFWQGHNGMAPAWVIVHGTAGGDDAKAMGQWMNTQTSMGPTSVHYVVDQHGNVVQLVSEGDSAWGNGVLSTGHDAFWDRIGTPNPNWRTISIEHVKASSDNSNALTPAQQSASFRLIADICRRHKIPGRFADVMGGITGHYSIDPVNRKFCPGPYPFEELFSYLATTFHLPPPGGNDSVFPQGIPQGWRDNGTTLTAPNGQPVIHGFRSTVLGRGWDPANVPMAPEGEVLAPANPLDPHSGPGVTQYFRDTVLVWFHGNGAIAQVPAGQLAFTLKGQLASTPSADAVKATAKKKALETAVTTAETELTAAIATAEQP